MVCSLWGEDVVGGQELDPAVDHISEIIRNVTKETGATLMELRKVRTQLCGK